jgi:hypothetical protein
MLQTSVSLLQSSTNGQLEGIPKLSWEEGEARILYRDFAQAMEQRLPAG